MGCWRRMEIIRTHLVSNEEVLTRVKEERNILETVKRGETNWICHILYRNCLLNHVTEGKIEGRIEVTGRRGIRRKQLTLRKSEDTGNCKRKHEVAYLGRGYGPVVRRRTG